VKLAKSLLGWAVLLAFAWLNWRGPDNGLIGSSKGFPFPFLTWTDVIPSLRIHLWALTADVGIALGMLAFAVRWRPKIRLSPLETAVLVTFALGFLWANSQMWFGTQHLLQNAPWIDRGNETVVYGFPFAYHVLVPENSLRPWMLIVNLALGAVAVVMIHRRFRTFDRRLPNTPLRPTAEKRGG
jgi:hypothetical protein